MKIITAQTATELTPIEELAKEIWEEHYTPIIGTQQVAYMLDKFQSMPAMLAQIADGYLYYSIYTTEELIGYLAVQPRNQQLFLSKIYLHHSTRGKGYGRKALDFVDSLARQLSLTSVSLTVNKYNSDTIQAYEKCGFIKGEAVVFDIGAGYIMDDYRMEKPLTS